MKKNKAYILLLTAISWLIVTIVLMTLPGSTLPSSPFFELIHLDKWVHITMFGLLVYLFLLFLIRQNITAMLPLAGIPLAGIAYGIAMEFVQKYWIPNRSFDVWDIVADAIGCLLAYGILCYRLRFATSAR